MSLSSFGFCCLLDEQRLVSQLARVCNADYVQLSGTVFCGFVFIFVFYPVGGFCTAVSRLCCFSNKSGVVDLSMGRGDMRRFALV